MRNLLRLTTTLGIAILAIVGAAGCNEYIGNLNEGLNLHNLAGTVVIPKAVLGTRELGVVYVGVFSGVDNRFGFLSPISAPAQVGGGDTYPYGGTSVGDFYTRDARFVCMTVADQTKRDAGANWEVDFDILQFPLYPGAAVWAFADNDNSTCNKSGGFYDAFAIYVTPTAVAPNGANFTVTVASTDLSAFTGPGSTGEVQLLDPAARLYKIVSINASAHTITVSDIFNYGVAPSVTGPYPSQLLKPTSNTYYGTQYQNVLNNPLAPGAGGIPYVSTGDAVPSVPTTIMNTANVTLTLDAKVN